MAWGAAREAAGLVLALAGTLEQALCRRGGPLVAGRAPDDAQRAD